MKAYRGPLPLETVAVLKHIALYIQLCIRCLYTNCNKINYMLAFSFHEEDPCYHSLLGKHPSLQFPQFHFTAVNAQTQLDKERDPT